MRTTRCELCTGAVWNLPVKIRAQKLASLPAPFNDIRTSKSATSSLNHVTPTSSTSATSTSLKWTPMTTGSEPRRPDDATATPSDKPVAGISVLKRDKLEDSSTFDVKTDNAPTLMNSHATAVDITDIENSFSDVSRSINILLHQSKAIGGLAYIITARQHSLLCRALY